MNVVRNLPNAPFLRALAVTLLLASTLAVPRVEAGFIFKPHYPDAGLRLSWSLDTVAPVCNGRLDEEQTKTVRRALRGRQQGMVQAWAGMYEDVSGRKARVGDADLRVSMVLGTDGTVSGVCIVTTSTDNRQLLDDIKRRLGSLRFPRLRLAACVTVILDCQFRLDLGKK